MAAAKGKNTKATKVTDNRKSTAKQEPEKTEAQDTQREDSAQAETANQPGAESEVQSSGAGEASEQDQVTDASEATAGAQTDDQDGEQGDAENQEEAAGETGEPSTPAASYPGEDGKDVDFDTLWIKARNGGFRRAGFQFSDREETVLAVADLDEEQVAALFEEPALIVTAGVKED